MVYLLQHLLINAAKRYPNKIAVYHREEMMTYGDLNDISDKLSIALIENGVKKGDRVGIYLVKSISSIVSIYGILKAGAVYVPLDPASPISRLQYIIKNCGIEYLITSNEKFKKLHRTITEDHPLKMAVITGKSKIDGIPSPIRTIPWTAVVEAKYNENPNLEVIETDLAYILYTSGSTGMPKGVMISHQNAFAFLNWIKDTFQITGDDRLSNHAPLHFDLSVFDIYGAAQAGASLSLVPDYISIFPAKLVDWIVENRISVWYSVPSILKMMVLHGNLKKHRFADLRTIIFAGEVFPIKYLRKLMTLIPHVDFYNLYGPTETNVITYYKLDEIPTERISSIPIGKACSNMEVFALNENGHLVTEPGEEGELCARGSCIAKGYWGDEIGTKKNFIINPLHSNYREIIYKTGDIVALDADQNFIYKGRVDQMIKSRGYRVELGEIESVLYNHPNIQEVAVVGIPDELVGNRIKAFLVSKTGKQISSSEMKCFCGENLPNYMIPDDIKFLANLPKTGTGKIDKLALA